MIANGILYVWVMITAMSFVMLSPLFYRVDIETLCCAALSSLSSALV